MRAHQTKIALAALAQEQLGAFEGHRQALDALLTAFVRESETAMAAREDRQNPDAIGGGHRAGPGSAAVRDAHRVYPIVQGAQKLLRQLMEMQDAARAYLVTADDRQLAALDARFEESAKASAILLKRLKRGVATPSQPMVDAVVQVFADRGAGLRGRRLIPTHRAALAANRDAQAETLKER